MNIPPVNLRNIMRDPTVQSPSGSSLNMEKNNHKIEYRTCYNQFKTKDERIQITHENKTGILDDHGRRHHGDIHCRESNECI